MGLVTKHAFVSLRTNPESAIKPSVFLENVSLLPMFATVTNLAAWTEERRELRINGMERASLTGSNRTN
jgi:hypothetical protein